MKVLVALQKFAHIAGTETYALTVTDQLQRLGHQVAIYAEEIGDMALLARDRAVDVVSDPDELGEPRDVLLTQDAAMAYALADRIPGSRSPGRPSSHPMREWSSPCLGQ